MKAGKVASIAVLLALIGLTAVVSIVAGELTAQGMSPIRSVLVIACAAAIVLAMVVLPWGVAFDRAISNLEASIDQAASGEEPTSGSATYSFVPTGFHLWLSPLTRAFTAMVDRCHQREQTLRNQVRDMEIRHRVSEAERRQTESVINALRDPVLVTNAYHEIVMVNAVAAQLFNFKVKDALHKPVASVIRDVRICKLIKDALESANCSDTRHVELELDAHSTNDSGQPASDHRALAFVGESNAQRQKPALNVYDVTLTCIANHKNEVGGVVTILRDLSREREVSQMKSDFVSKASHELRTPLSSIRAYIEMLVDGDFQSNEVGESNLAMDHADEKSSDGSPTSLDDIYRILQDETERLSRLIDNMLNISRIEAGIVQIDREPVDMKALIDRAVHTLVPEAEAKHIALIAKPSAIDLSVEGDADMLYQALLNLVSNAIKYTPADSNGRVTISADSDNLTRSVVVSVSDTGLGVPPDSIEKLFDKFFRVENYKRVAKGTGLGLSLCKHIIETVHQGQVGVESKLGLGSRFWFSIPMCYAGSQAA